VKATGYAYDAQNHPTYRHDRPEHAYTNSQTPYTVNWDVSDYYPFGGERVLQSNSTNNRKFTGKERDSESGNDNFGARYYSSSLGRFLSPDEPLLDQEARDPQSWNLYRRVAHLCGLGSWRVGASLSRLASLIRGAGGQPFSEAMTWVPDPLVWKGPGLELTSNRSVKSVCETVGILSLSLN
jgi:RHS repeat-associated protein